MVVDSSPEVPSEAAEALAARAHRTGVLVNAGLTTLKLAVGFGVGSSALVADGVHSLSDVASTAFAGIAWRLSRQPPDSDHHYGHGKFEAFASLGLGLGMLGFGVAVVVGAWDRGPLAADEAITYAPDLLWLALSASLISILANEWLVKLTRRAAQAARSHSLMAVSRDNRSDSISSALVLVSLVFSGLGDRGYAELVCALWIGAAIVFMGGRTVRESFGVLTDRADPEIGPRVEAVAEGVAGVEGVQAVRAHPIGGVFHVDMEISVDGALTVRKGHAIAHEVVEAVTRGVDEVVEVSVHVNPHGSPGA